MKTKAEIFDLINKSDLNAAFEALNELFKGDNDRLNALMDAYIDQANNFKPGEFASRLKAFINRYYQPLTHVNLPLSPIPVSPSDMDDYDLLCELDFKLQTEHFQCIYKHKKIAAFLLHGEGDEQGADGRWLCRQLLYKSQLLQEKPILVDLGAPQLGSPFERLLKDFYAHFEIDKPQAGGTRQIVSLRKKMEDRLSKGHLVCIVNSTQSLLTNQPELKRLFDDFLSFMDEHITQGVEKYSLIFLFVEHTIADYASRDDKYFLWYKEPDNGGHAMQAVTCPDLKIIDLAPIAKIQEKDIADWIRWTLKTHFYHKYTLSRFYGKEQELLAAGNSPFQVIKKICTDINIEIQKTWTI